MGPSYSAGLPNSFQRGTPSSTRSSTMSFIRRSDEVFVQGGIFLAGVVIVEPAALEEGFYSTLFLVPKTEGRMRPIINLKVLNFWVHPRQ